MTVTIQDLIDELSSIEPERRHLPIFVADWSNQDAATGHHYGIYSVSAFDEDQPISHNNPLAINAVISKDPVTTSSYKSFHYRDSHTGKTTTYQHPNSVAHAILHGDIRPGHNPASGSNNDLIFADSDAVNPHLDDTGIAITSDISRWRYENPFVIDPKATAEEHNKALHQQYHDLSQYIIKLTGWHHSRMAPIVKE